ncbi:MAG: adenosylmethionine--8-amino-7-oxononanoate transaminase [Cyanobacteriota bacterium]
MEPALGTGPAALPGWHPNLWHPSTQVALADPPLRVVAGRGAWLELEDGRTLIDGISSWWVTLHGHAEPTIAAAIAEQATRLEQVIFANFRHAPAERLAERLSALTGLSRLFFSDNGSTAVEVALKIAWQWWRNQGTPRSRLIAFEGAYHGDTVGAMALGERSLFSAPFEPLLFEVARAPWPATWWGDAHVEEKEAEALAALERLLETPTAAVILEPLVQGASGMRMVRPGFLREVERRVRQAGALLIADEVLMGFGRGGALFASSLAGLTPDLMALSKGLTGGFLPMAVTLASERLHAGFIGTDPRLTLHHGHSFTANPLGCAAALASLDLLLATPERHEGLEARHRPLLEELAALPPVRRPRLRGTIAAFDVVPPDGAEPEGYLNPIGRRLHRRLLAEGVFLRPLGQVVYLLPPLCVSDAELRQCYGALATALREL